MLLLIDAGNTSIKWALAEPLAPSTLALAGTAPGQWVQSAECAHPEVEQLSAAWHTGAANASVSRVLVSNVAGAALGARLAAQLLQAFGADLPVQWFASQPALAGVRNGYRDPAQLGCDRFAAAIGAHALFPQQALIVAHCGTATTIDALTADGVFLGGMILPGLGLMMRSLALHTAQLPQTAPQPAALDRFADNTVDAIVSGCIMAQVGALERALVLHAQSQATAVQCVLGGGAAAWIAPHLKAPCARVDNLVLIGLQVASAYDDMLK